VELLRESGAAPDGRVFVDVGANIGTTTLPALARYGFERAIAVEPEPENVRLLRANAALNRLDQRVVVVEAAVGSSPGRAAFRRGKQTRHGWRAGAGSLLKADRSGGPEIEIVTVDGVLAELGVDPASVGLLWLDVQGYEGHALAGATGLIDAGVPVVFASRPRKLAKAGKLDELVERIATGYTQVADLRPTAAVEGWQPAPRPAIEIEGLLQARATTDILAFGPRPAAVLPPADGPGHRWWNVGTPAPMTRAG
jgi:FkbM family methyltransferase